MNMFAPRQKQIYFLKPVGMVGPIKIGCSEVVGERLSTFMNWSPIPLEVVCSTDGGHEVERALHRRYAGARLHSEWFTPTSQMLSDLEILKSGVSIAMIVGDGPEIERRKKADWKARKVSPLFSGETAA